MTVDGTQKTVDDVPVKVGDVVWTAYPACGIRRCRLYSHHLGMWWERTSEFIYSTERSALEGAIAREQKALAKARREVARSVRLIARLTRQPP